jgi:hypothetical protein
MAEDRCYSHENAKIDFCYSTLSFEQGLCDEITQYLSLKEKRIKA